MALFDSSKNYDLLPIHTISASINLEFEKADELRGIINDIKPKL